MNKSLFALSLLFTAAMQADTYFSSPTQSLYKAIQTADRELFHSALIAGADVNAVDINTGYTPLMAALVQVIPNELSINNRKAGVFCATFVTSIIAPFIAGAVVVGIAEAQRQAPHPITLLSTIAISSLATGFITYKGLKNLFVSPKVAAESIIIDMIYTLLNHPSINLDITHDISGKTVLNAITDVLNPQFATYTSTTYHHVGGGNYAFSLPSTSTHVSAQFTVFNTPYSMHDYEYNNLIKPVFEKLFRTIYYQKPTSNA